MVMACIDEEIFKHRLESLRLRAERNSLSLTYRLPAEILEAIFVSLARDFYGENNGIPTLTTPNWVNVSYVCRHWRIVALNCPTLWTYLFVLSPRWTEELLARSKQAPLELYMNTNYWHERYHRVCFAEQVMNHVERVEALRLHLPLTPEEHQLFSSCAPRLKHLTISTTTTTPPEWEWPLRVLFDGNTATLRTLDLTFCPVPWCLPKLGSLTTLVLRSVPTRFQQNPAEFLATLKCMPKLIHLYLDDALASAASFLSSSTFKTFQKINLPHLCHLLIAAPLSTVTVLLSCMNIPLRTHLKIQCHHEDGFSPDNYALLSSLVSRRFCISDDQTQFGPVIRSLVVSLEWSMETLVFSTSERCSSSSILRRDRACNVPFQIIIPFGLPMNGVRDRMISNICCSIPLTNVQSLHVIFPLRSSAFWSKMLAQLQNLRHLKLSEGCMPDLASILSPAPCGCTQDQGGRAGRVPDRVLAPALEDLELYNVSFSRPGSTSPPFDVQHLCDALALRTKPRGRLTISRCSLANFVEMDMVGTWGDGYFQVVHECSRPDDDLES